MSKSQVFPDQINPLCVVHNDTSQVRIGGNILFRGIERLPCPCISPCFSGSIRSRAERGSLALVKDGNLPLAQVLDLGNVPARSFTSL